MDFCLQMSLVYTSFFVELFKIISVSLNGLIYVQHII